MEANVTKEKICKTYNKVEDAIMHFFKKYGWIFIIVVGVILSTIGKACAFGFKSGDFNGFIHYWMLDYKQMGIVGGFGASLGDYTPLYNYFLCIMAQFTPESGFVYAVKIFNLLFEYSLAAAFFFIGYHYKKNLNFSAIICVVALIIPSVIINGAFWGQCDVIYTSFIVWSFYFILKKKPDLAMIFFSISFCFKLQSIFFLPFVAILILKRKIKIYQLLYIPIVYIIVALPAVFCGRNFGEIMSIYFKQVDEYYSLSLSAPSLYSFFDNNLTEIISPTATVIFFVVIMTFIFYVYLTKVELNDQSMLSLLMMSALFSPFFLPNMHERYFFMSDIIAFIYLFMNKKWRPLVICALTNFASITCCCYWLFAGVADSNFFTHFNVIRVCSVFNLIAVLLLMYELIKLPKEKEVQTESK